ncbi:hypothetical protein SALBM135S_01129 [Streptomyces alboniger]
MGDEHRLVVLLLVLRDHPEGEARLGERGAVERRLLQHVEDASADLGRVAAGLTGGEQRQVRPFGARVLEGVVQRVDLGPHGVAAPDRAQQPLLLLVADVREVPDER